MLCESQWQGPNCRAELCGELGKYRARQHCTLSHGWGHELTTRKISQLRGKVPGMPAQDCPTVCDKWREKEQKVFEVELFLRDAAAPVTLMLVHLGFTAPASKISVLSPLCCLFLVFNLFLVRSVRLKAGREAVCLAEKPEGNK